MSWHLYLLPVIGTGTEYDTWRAKYLQDLGLTCSTRPIGMQPVCVAGADIEDDQDASLSKQEEVIRIPDDLDRTLNNGSILSLQGMLEDAGVPTEWMMDGMSCRDMLQRLLALADFLCRFHAIEGSQKLVLQKDPWLTKLGLLNLDTPFETLHPDMQASLLQTATEKSIGTDTVRTSSPVRDLLALVVQTPRSTVIGEVSI